MPWLMKAEPETRIVKGKDVKFSVDDFEEIGVSPWDGVRNHLAKNIMKDKMKMGDNVLFYHSNCKEPGVFGLATVAKEGYPDYSAWDSAHPYFDPKTVRENPTWYMVDVEFKQRLAHPPTLALIKHLTTYAKVPPEVAYIGDKGLEALKGMVLVNQGRLSVQPVTDEAYDAVVKLGTKGGWEDLVVKAKAKPKKQTLRPAPSARPKSKRAGEEDEQDGSDAKPLANVKTTRSKRAKK